MHFSALFRRSAPALATLALGLGGRAPLLAAETADASPIERLPEIRVTAAPAFPDISAPLRVSETIAAPRIVESVNIVDPQDAAKYFPSVFFRKRNFGDTQPVMATRVWGVSSSARSLVYADGVLLSALIANNNTIGAPRWGLVSPIEIERVDVFHGPFSAAYAGNSMGAVLEITTRLPERREIALSGLAAWQTFSQYGTKEVYPTTQGAVAYGDRRGRLSFWLSAQRQDSASQPLSYVTSATLPAGVSGGYAARNKLGASAPVVGATGLLQTGMTNGKAKVAYDLTPWLRAAYTVGVWRNDAHADVETYLRDAAGRPTFAGLSGFASGRYELEQQHSAHAFSLRTAAKGPWSFQASLSRYRMERDRQRLPAGVTPLGADFSTEGREVELSGVGWTNFDAKARWDSDLEQPRHTAHVGVHWDAYRLANPTYATADWQRGGRTRVATEGNGNTRTRAVWGEELWRIRPDVSLTLGARYEQWLAYGGYNRNGSAAAAHPSVSATKLSPKASLQWLPSPRWTLTASVAQAYRFATAAELFQLVSTGATFTAPRPDLKPDDVLATEVRLERTFDLGRIKLSAFRDEIEDAIVAQFNPLAPGSTQLYSYLSNVDRVRAQGVELALERRRCWDSPWDIAGSITYLDARTRALSGRPSATAGPEAAIGKRLPNIPEWRGTAVATYRPNERWSFTIAGRYSGMLYTTLDNADVNPNTWQGFGEWFVLDLRAHRKIGARGSVSAGVENALDREYFLFHPFPQRTFVVDTRWTF